MRISKLGSGAALVFILAACGGTVETGGSGGQGSSSSSASSGASSGTGSGAACGGFLGATCAAGEFCAYADRGCGAADGAGVCVRIPEACDLDYAPVCGCDGMVYGNACSANAMGVDLAAQGCTAPSGYFSCGGLFCPIDTTYCEHGFSDVGGEPEFYSCKALPASCGGKADCVCAASAPCGDRCMTTPDGGIELICLGG
jgi:Kazal-type serine protease inhibitor domain